MASVYYLVDDAQDIANNVIENTEARFELDKKRFFAALIIQRSFRGFLVRTQFQKWTRAAIIIQKNVRGFLLRLHLTEIAADVFRRKCLNMFNKMTIKIQAAWRGYWVRKRFEIKQIIAEKKAAQQQFEAMQKLFGELFKRRMQDSSDFSLGLEESPEEVRRIKKLIRKSPEIVGSLFDRHHLLRTYQTEGVLSIHETKDLSVLEKFLKRFDYKSYMSNVKKIFKTSPTPKIEYMFTDKRTRRMEDLFRIKNHREGPFKKTDNMDKLIENGVHDEPFKLIAGLDVNPYKRTLMSQEEYTGLKQITFRDRIKQDMSKHDFDLDVHHMGKNPKDEPPYLIDHWKKACCNHNFMYDFMEKRNG